MLVERVISQYRKVESKVSSWVSQELSGLDIGDKRLDKRAQELLEQFTKNITSGIPQACGDWAGARGAYRFFKNEKTSSQKIYMPHQANTNARMSDYELILAVQDTCLLDYTLHLTTKGLGPIGTEKQQMQGLVMHTTMALVPDGLPLGILNQQIWAREATKLSESEKKARPIEEKESFKWIEAIREAVAHTPSGVKLVNIGDREADVYELFVEAAKLKTGLLIRATQNRCLMSPEEGKIWDNVVVTPIMVEYKVEVPTSKGQPARTATASIKFASVTLKPPWRKDAAPLPPIQLQAILVNEINPPADVEPLEWKLLTNQPVDTFEMALECVKWYCLRWSIELFHKILKSGCKVEDCRLSAADRLKPYLALQSIVAWRVLWITHLNRTQPDAPATLILDQQELVALYAFVNNTTSLPQNIPTVRQAVLWIAQLGGFLARKSDGQPGSIVIWRGLKRLADIIHFYSILTHKLVGNC